MQLLPLTMLLMWGEQWIGLRAVLCASYATESLLVTRARSSRLRILYVEAHSKTWVSYYADTVRSLGKLHELQYLRLTEQSDHARRTRLARAIKDGGGHFDVLVLGWGYLSEEANQWLPPEFMQSLQIPLAIVLNKEYVDLERKLQYIHGCNAVAAFTAHHEVPKYTNVTQIQFHRIPFAAVPQKFDFASVPSPKLYRYDFGFTGIMRKEQTQNWREQILNDLKNFRDLGIRMFTQTGLKFRPLPSKKYRKILQQTRIWLSTTGPEDLVGTRYFEVLMSGTTMLICNRIAKVYDGLFEEDRHVVMFSSLEELRRKVKYYIDNEQERQKIVRQAHTLALANHSFDNRARELGCILKDSIDYRSRPKSQTLKGPIPWELVSQQDEFTMNGNFPLRSRALRRQDQPGSWSNGQLPRGFKPVVNGLIVRWPVKAVEALVQAVFSGIDISPPDYPKAALLICRALEQVKGIGSKALVLGSISPWVEAILLSKNYTVLTADYNLPECAFPGINFIPMASLALYVRSFDLVVSYSSIEHDGLGRYGDPIDPSGDFYAMKEIKSLLAPGGMLFLGVPVSENVGGLHFNRHRIYNKVRLSELVSEFEYMGIVWNSENIQLTRKHFTHMDIWRSQKSNNQPLLLLKKSETC